MRGTKVIAVLAVILGLAASGAAQALEWYFQTPASGMARDIDMLHQYVMWLIIVIVVGVFGFMFWACYAHRKSVGHQAAQFHENTLVEVLWTVIPAIIVAAIAWPVVVRVVAQEEYSKWVGEHKALAAKSADDETKAYTLDQLKARGEIVQPADIKARRK